MQVHKVVELDGNSLLFEGELTYNELQAVISVGLNKLLQDGAFDPKNRLFSTLRNENSPS